MTNDPGQWGGTCDIAANASSTNSCTLPVDGTTTRAMASNLPYGTSEVHWQYALNLPANQPEGSYSWSEVTFTATTST